MQKVDIKFDKDSCWLWLGCKSSGYGQLAAHGGRLIYAHRLSYELAQGPIPEGLQIDHLCRTPACVRPDHLEAVTPRENTMRGDTPARLNLQKTHCPYGHAYDERNTCRIRGERRCRACACEKRRRYAKTLPQCCVLCGAKLRYRERIRGGDAKFACWRCI